MDVGAVNSRGEKVVSYCIPVFNRREELLLTLGRNLEENRQYQQVIEFVVLIYDKASELYDELSLQFASDVQSGYLVLARSAALNVWHFGKAKNGFKNLIHVALYSSLDADNFVMSQETKLLLCLHEYHGVEFLLHGFSGAFGDGTCGRVTTGRQHYVGIGYDEHLMPRQFDEFDFMLSILRACPALPLIRYDSAMGTLDRSAASVFMRKERFGTEVIAISQPKWQAPMHPRGKDYVSRDDTLRLMQIYNQSMSFAKNSADPDTRRSYYQKAWEAANDIVDVSSPGELMLLFYGVDLAVPPAETAGVSVFSCLKDEGQLADWLDHHRKLGCRRFFLVNDGSELDLGSESDAPDVHVFKPVVGSFRSCKIAWIRTLMKAFVAEGDWVLTVDGDEYIEIADPIVSTLPELAEELEVRHQDRVAGLLVDMLPSTAWLNSSEFVDYRQIVKIFDSHIWQLPVDAEIYAAAQPVRWGFGSYWKLSAMVDARYQLFGTFDSLRKIPFFQYHHDIVINQGFHDLCRNGRGLSADEVWNGGLLAVKHYKLAKLFAPSARAGLDIGVTGDAYHVRTRSNVVRLLEIESEELRRKMLGLNLRTFDAARFARVQPQKARPRL